MALDVEQFQVGNDAAWLLSFDRQVADPSGFLTVVEDPPVLEIGSDDYYAQINASLPAGLEGGVYTFVIEGLTDAHYRLLKAQERLVVKLFLYWRDTDARVAGLLNNIAAPVQARDIPDALVAVLSVLSISRRAGSRLYETTITARERVFEILNSRRVCGTTIEAPPEDAVARLLLGRVKLKEFQFHGALAHPVAKFVPAVQGSQNDGKLNLRPGGPALQLLRDIGNRLEQKTGRYGRGMFLIRDGLLHIGTRSIPFHPASAPGDTPPTDTRPTIDRSLKTLTPANGLIEFQALEAIATDPNFDACALEAPVSFTEEGPPLRRQFQLTLKGRPDIKPGDVAIFEVPTEENGDEQAGFGVLPVQVTAGVLADPSVLGGSNGQAVQLYVSTVDHKLSRTGGFVTTIAGVEFTSEANQWDGHTPASERTPAFKASSDVKPETSAGKAVQRLVKSHVDAMHFAEVCEVRRATTQGRAEPPSQTVDLLCGLEPGDGHANQSRRLAINRKDADRASGVPYATPFAWGKCGLVLPRYPGTRVVSVSREGRADDLIDVGAIWESGRGPDSQPGDWWLILPAGVPAQRRQENASDQAPPEHEGKVSQDLIDADGNRVIEVGQLTIVVLPQAKLRAAGQRPEHGEHVPGGASIIVKPDGSIAIKAERIELDAGEGDITMKARNVNVKVTGSMDVS
jgi:hypothetical protein